MGVMHLKAQLQCLCTNARSMGNKQQELETVVHLILLLSCKCGEMICVTGILPLGAVGFLEGIGKVAGVWGGCFLC